MGGRLYLHMFVIRVELSILIKMGPGDGSGKFLPLLAHTAAIVQCGDKACGGLMAMHRGRCFKVIPETLPRVLADSTLHSVLHSSLLHSYTYIIPHFCCMLSSSIGDTRMFFSCLLPLKFV